MTPLPKKIGDDDFSKASLKCTRLDIRIDTIWTNIATGTADWKRHLVLRVIWMLASDIVTVLDNSTMVDV